MKCLAVAAALILPCLLHTEAVSELQRMLAAYPQADRNDDGVLTEQEAADYVSSTRQRGRKNRGPGIRDTSLINAYEARNH